MTIQALWIGPALSPMERLSLSSFIAAGHDVHLYVYDQVAHVPAGVVVRDANQILPSSRIFRYREHDSVAGFANHFRYKLLLERGGWWADTDIVCLRPFDFEEQYVVASEKAHGKTIVTNCVMRVPAGSPAVEEAWRTCESVDPSTLEWGQTGPKLWGDIVRRHDLDRYIQPPTTFCPIPWYEWRRLIDPGAVVHLPKTTYAIHLWHEMWRRGRADKARTYHHRTLYEQLKQRVREQE